MENNKTQEHLANERTFLSWLRTGVATMAFGFVVVRFSLFLTQLSLLVNKSDLKEHKEYSAIAGNILVAAGMLTIILGYVRYKKNQKQISTGGFQSSHLHITLLTALILLLSLCLIVLLLLSV